MNRLRKQLVCITVLASAAHLFGDAGTTPMIVPRSQSFNAARQMIGWNNPEWGINRYPQDKYYQWYHSKWRRFYKVEKHLVNPMFDLPPTK